MLLSKVRVYQRLVLMVKVCGLRYRKWLGYRAKKCM